MHALQLPGCSLWPMAQGYGHGERIFDVAFHPFSNDIVLTASEDTSVRMWRRPDGSTMYKQVRAFLGHSGEALRACWSANGMLLASGSADRTVRLWAADLNEQGYTGRQLAVLDGHPEEVYHVELVNPAAPPPNPYTVQPGPRPGGDGGLLPPFETHVLVASSESLFIWSLQEGAVSQQADAPGTSGSTITQDAIMGGSRPSYIFGVCRQPGGSLVAAACCDGTLRLWSLRPTGRLEWVGQVVLPGQPMCNGCAFTADGTRVGLTTRAGDLVEVDVRTMQVLTSLELPASPLTLAYLPAGASAAAVAVAAAVGSAGAAGAAAASSSSVSSSQSPPAMWLVACRDGAVYGYQPGQQAGPPSCVLRPPTGEGVAVLAVAVARGGSAVALGGEPQDAALLPPMRQQPLTAPPPPAAPPASGAVQPAAPAVTAAAAAGVAGAGGTTSTSAVPAGPAAAAAAAATVPGVTTAPPRRRGAGSGRVVAGGLATRNPLALFEGSEGERPQQWQQPHGSQQGGADRVAGEMAALALGGQQQQQPQQQPGGTAGGGEATEAEAASSAGGKAAPGSGSQPRPQQQLSSSGEEEDVSMGDQQQQPQSHHQGGAAAPSGRTRAPLLVYRGGGNW